MKRCFYFVAQFEDFPSSDYNGLSIKFDSEGDMSIRSVFFVSILVLVSTSVSFAEGGDNEAGAKGCREVLDAKESDGKTFVFWNGAKLKDEEAAKKAVADYYAKMMFDKKASVPSKNEIKAYCDSEVATLEKLWGKKWVSLGGSKTGTCLALLKPLCESGELYAAVSSADHDYEYVHEAFRRNAKVSCRRPKDEEQHICFDLSQYASHADLFNSCSDSPVVQTAACPAKGLVASCSTVDFDGHQNVVVRSYDGAGKVKFKENCEKGGNYIPAQGE